MADKAEAEEASVEEKIVGIFPRDKELSTIERYKDDLEKIAQAVESGYEGQQKRTSQQMDYWDMWECVLNGKQSYSGNAELYMPLVHDAIEARSTRFTNQVFPSNQRYVDVVTTDGEIPFAEMALLNAYIRKAKLRTEIVPPMNRNGDIEGQYNLYCTWSTHARHVTSRESDNSVPGATTETFEEDIILDSHPIVEVLPDADVMVWPASANSIREALSKGGGVAVTRRWTEDQIDSLAKHGDITKEAAETIKGAMKDAKDDGGKNKNPAKVHVDAVGIKLKGKFYLAREVWHMLEVERYETEFNEETKKSKKKLVREKRTVRSFFGGNDGLANRLIGTKVNPFWCDQVPVFSAPATKISGSFKGKSKVQPIESLQYFANDIMNQGADAATLALNPIVKANAEAVPKNANLFVAPGAVWDVSKPGDIEFAAFPPLYQHALEIVNQCKAQIQQSLGVNPSMIPQSSSGMKRKPSQAEIANEQSVDVLTTSDVVTIQEEGILTPLVNFMVELDMQFRDEDVLVPAYGMMGKRAKMERIEPLQRGTRREYRWLGVEQARNAARIQQQTALMNVIKGIPPQMYQGYRLNMVPFIEANVESAFGPLIAPLIFVSEKDQLSMDPETENEMLSGGFDVQVNPMDDDVAHIKAHMPLLSDDASQAVRIHIMHHQAQMKMKAQAQQMAQTQQQQGGPPGPGGGPREGAQPMGPRPQGPPGAIHADQMPTAGAVPFPRKA